MTWVYVQKTGEIRHDGQPVGFGYSGFGEGKNNPDKEKEKNVGPIPKGAWHIGKPYDHANKGPYVMALTPLSCTDTHGRSAFLIHGDSISSPGMASHGCIILSRRLRENIGQSNDTTLEVV